MRIAEKEEVITRHGKAAGVLIGFKREGEWFEYRLPNDPRFLKRIDAARQSLEDGRGNAWRTQAIEARLGGPRHPDADHIQSQ